MGRARPFPLLAAVTAVATLSAGCSEGSGSASPELPSSTCFGAFTPAELEPFMGTGREVRVESPVDVRLTSQRESAICNIEVDGKNRFHAAAHRKPAGHEFLWPPLLDEQNPEGLPFAENSKLWDRGAAVVLTCEGLTDSFVLRLWIDGVPDDVKPAERRPKFTALMAKFLESAKQQAQCGSA